jgi:hypothetical protein
VEEGIDRQPELLLGVNTVRFITICIVVIILLVSLLTIRAVDKQGSIDGVVVFSRQSRGHDDGYVSEESDIPPVGGLHHAQFQNCGIYLSPIESGKAVHSMEHGAIWITYEPGLPVGDVTLLQEKVRGSEYLLLSPFIGQRYPIVLTAWGAQLALEKADDPRIDQFLTRYLLGPAIPERGAACKGGLGQPVS